MTQQSLLKKALLLSGVALFAFAAPAKAGFEWKGPLETPQTAAPMPEAPAMQAAPTTPVDAQGMSPDASMAPVTDSGMSPAPGMTSDKAAAQNSAAPTAMPEGWSKDAAAQAAAMPVSHDDAAASQRDVMPAMDKGASMNNGAAMDSSAAAMNGSAAAGPVLNGFGSDLPLVIALQQIVPPGYQYSFANGVNPGVSVSWQGGKPWQQVLGDTLDKQNLGYRIQNNTVVIGNFGNSRAHDDMMDSKSGMNDMSTMPAPAMSAPAPAASASTAAKPAADMPAPLWDSADAGKDSASAKPAANSAPVSGSTSSDAAANDMTPMSLNSASTASAPTTSASSARTPIISPSTSANRAGQLPADLGGYAAHANDGSSMSAAPAASAATDMGAADMSSAPAGNNMSGNNMSGNNTGATDTAATADAASGKPQTVVIHRQKPSSLFQRLGWAKSPKRDARNQEDIKAATLPAAPTAAQPGAAQPAAGDADSSQNTVAQPGASNASMGANDLALPPPAYAGSNAGMTGGDRLASAASPTPLSMTDASPATPVSAATAAGANGWSAHRGDSLRDTLTAWSNKAGVKLYWSIDYDYHLTDNAAYSGAYDEAVGDLLGKFASVRPQPYGQLHQSADGSRVLVVKSYDLTH